MGSRSIWSRNNNVVFYEDCNGVSELFNELPELAHKVDSNKDARIQYQRIILYIELLKKNGIKMPSNITKHIDDDIWELRPRKNRVLYFYFHDNLFVLLHMFKKTTRKNQKKEIEKAKKECMDYKLRNEEK